MITKSAECILSVMSMMLNRLYLISNKKCSNIFYMNLQTDDDLAF
jgi:hypothetical protein